MQTLKLELGARSYPIYIGGGLLSRSDLLASHIGGKQVMVVSNVTVAPLYLDQALAALKEFECHTLVLPDGEQYKTLDTLNLIFDALLRQRCDRHV
ncbi:MAG: 3-dehydroquinate synthase, partial [Gammaproteobacteria bacterium]|nr:3-dehydroquinate synthase [Gammaproteobacteria bacterium]